MIKLNNTQPRSMTVQTAPASVLETGRRLIVLLPSSEMDMPTVARRVWQLAKTWGASVLFLGRYSDSLNEPSLRRTLVTLVTMVNDGNVRAESQVVTGRNWVEIARSPLQKGDTIVCWREQHTELLRAKLDVPLYIMSQSETEPASTPGWQLQGVVAWAGSLAIIVGFFFIQARIGQLANGWTAPLQLLSVASEFGLIGVWNNLFA